jgi:hypothetical protein
LKTWNSPSRRFRPPEAEADEADSLDDWAEDDPFEDEDEAD